MYHWLVHGSKKATDLAPLNSNGCWQRSTSTPQIICHDQEPLNFKFYKDTWETYYNNWIDQQESHRQPLYRTIEIKEYLRKYHLRSIIDTNGGATIYDACILLHSEKNSIDLELYKNSGFIPVYYWSHALIARDWFRYAAVDQKLSRAKNIKHTFLIYNRAWAGSREYRLKFAEYLVNTGLVNFSKTAFSKYDSDRHYKDHVMSNCDFELQRFDLETVFDTNTSPSWASAEYSVNDYNSTLCEVVLETMFDDSRVHLTEKILRPIACNQPFIVLAGPGSLEYLRGYGFKTFDGLIDESYDTITNSAQRLKAVVKEMQKIASFTDGERSDFLEKTKIICEHNRQWFFSKDFFDLIVNEFKENINLGLTQIEDYKNGKMWFGLRDTAREYHPELFVTCMRQNNEDWARSQLRSSTPSQSSGNN